MNLVCYVLGYPWHINFNNDFFYSVFSLLHSKTTEKDGQIEQLKQYLVSTHRIFPLSFMPSNKHTGLWMGAKSYI